MNEMESVKNLVRDAGITRRNFAEGALLGAGLSLLAMAAPAEAAAPSGQADAASNGKAKIRYMGLVLASPAAGRAADFEKWFNDVHIVDVIKAKDFKSGQLFRLDRNLDGKFPTQYVAVYIIETDDMDAVRADMARLEKNGGMRFEGSDAVDMSSLLGSVFVPVAELRQSAG